MININKYRSKDYRFCIHNEYIAVHEDAMFNWISGVYSVYKNYNSKRLFVGSNALRNCDYD